MRILHVIPQFPWFGGRTIIGGHASCLLTLALAQVAGGDEVTILSHLHGRAGDVEIEPGLLAHSLFAEGRTGTSGFGLRLARAAAAWTRARRHDFDVVHVHSGFADYCLVSHRLRRITGRPTLHTLYCPIPRTGGRWRMPLVRSLIRRWANGLDGLVAMSQNVASSMRDFGLPDVTVVAPPVDTGRFAPGDAGDVARMRAELDLEPGDVGILFVGNAKPQKNLTGALRAMHAVRTRHPAAKLVMTTELKQSSSDADLESLRREMDSLGLEPFVIQRGIVKDMPRLMRSCDMLVAPFLDSFGPSDFFMAALEMMACGRPVIVSNAGGMPEVVGDDVGRLVDPHDPDSIAAALALFIADPARRDAAGRAARTYTQQHFDPGLVAARYRELYTGSAR